MGVIHLFSGGLKCYLNKFYLQTDHRVHMYTSKKETTNKFSHIMELLLNIFPDVF